MIPSKEQYKVTPNEYLRGKTNICQLIDPGHGGVIDGKYTTYPSKMKDWGSFVFYEGVYNRLLAYNTMYHCREMRLNYKLLVPESDDISLDERVHRAELFQANHPELKCYYHSIHGNAFGVSSVNGVEVYTYHGKSASDKIASTYYHYLEWLKWKMRPDTSDGDPDKEAAFYVLKYTSMPAILTETGFYTNLKQATDMASPRIQDKIGLIFAVAQQQIKDEIFN